MKRSGVTCLQTEINKTAAKRRLVFRELTNLNGRYIEQLRSSIDANALLRNLYANMPPPKPLTRMERLQRRLQDLKDAIRVARGEAVSIDWYDE